MHNESIKEGIKNQIILKPGSLLHKQYTMHYICVYERAWLKAIIFYQTAEPMAGDIVLDTVPIEIVLFFLYLETMKSILQAIVVLRWVDKQRCGRMITVSKGRNKYILHRNWNYGLAI